MRPPAPRHPTSLHAASRHDASSSWPRSTNRGSVLMVALIFAFVIALSLTSYLSLASHAAKMANRSFYMDGARDLTDVGLEQTLWALNNKNWTGGNFAASAGSTDKFQGTFPSSSTYFPLSNGAKGQVKVWVDMSDAVTPHVVSKAIIKLPNGDDVVRISEAYLKQRSYYDDGMVGDTIDIRGQCTGDSWVSDDGNPATPPVPYSSGVARDNTRFSATSVTVSALDVGQATIRGNVAVGSPETGGGLAVGSQGTVGDNAWVSSHRGIQDGHATYDFSASFPDEKNPTPPDGSTVPVLTTASTTLPRRNAAGTIIDSPASDGYYYYSIPTIDLSGNVDTLTVSGGKVILTATTSTGTSIKATGNHSGIVVNSNSELKLYTAGDVAITGNGILNGGVGTTATTSNQPKNFQLYGTRTKAAAATSGPQSFDVKGNGYLSGVIYGPNANVTINGNGDILGAVVGHNVVMTGNAAFHYDESLPKTLVTGLWGLKKWRELSTPTELAAYTTQLSF